PFPMAESRSTAHRVASTRTVVGVNPFGLVLKDDRSPENVGDRLTRISRDVEGAGPTSASHHLRTQGGHHGAVVGAQSGPRDADTYADLGRALLQHRPEPTVRRDASAEHDRV